MQETRQIKVGDEAPDFCLPAVQGTAGQSPKEEVCLHDFRGNQPVVLTFYGAAFTPV